jgi:hypothetical protein
VNRPSLLRPTLLPGLRPLWRDSRTVQLGTDPSHAIVLELPHRAAARLLDLLDGSRTERAVIAEVARIGMSERDARAALDALTEAGLVVAAHTLMPTALTRAERERLAPEAAALALRRAELPCTPAQILRGRAAARVIIAGEGHLAEIISQSLYEAGVGTIAQVTRPGATAETTETAGIRPRRVRATDATFVVQIGPTARAGTSGARRRVPHLYVGTRDGIAVVGPLVPSTGGPCLDCLDLHRRDRDPAWPTIAAQLAEAPSETCTAATRLIAAGLTVAEALACLDGCQPSTVGATVEINGVAPWRRRTWTPHPSCDCTRRRRQSARIVAQM